MATKRKTARWLYENPQGLAGLGLAVRTPQKTAILAVLQNVGSVIQKSGVLFAPHREFWGTGYRIGSSEPATQACGFVWSTVWRIAS